MIGEGYECNSCSYILFVEDNIHKSLWCPSCRATLYPADIEKPADCVSYECAECGARFGVPKGAHPPYKCPRCNYTFPSNPDRRVRHKL
jgi:DNA-directed RNA polymerase subunit RPC12/RpoP